MKVNPESSIVAGSQKNSLSFSWKSQKVQAGSSKESENVERNGGAGIFCHFVVLLTFGNITD